MYQNSLIKNQNGNLFHTLLFSHVFYYQWVNAATVKFRKFGIVPVASLVSAYVITLSGCMSKCLCNSLFKVCKFVTHLQSSIKFWKFLHNYVHPRMCIVTQCRTMILYPEINSPVLPTYQSWSWTSRWPGVTPTTWGWRVWRWWTLRVMGFPCPWTWSMLAPVTSTTFQSTAWMIER